MTYTRVFVPPRSSVAMRMSMYCYLSFTLIEI